MVEILSHVHRIAGGLSVLPDILKVLVVFLCASLFYFILFSAQILLIYRIEQGSGAEAKTAGLIGRSRREGRAPDDRAQRAAATRKSGG